MTDFIPSPGFLLSTAVEVACNAQFHNVVDVAVELAPKRTGHLAASIEGHWIIEDGRKIFRITAHDFKSGWIEHGTVNMDPEPFLGPAVMQVLGNLT